VVADVSWPIARCEDGGRVAREHPDAIARARNGAQRNLFIGFSAAALS
jgi:hypothetical protein